MKYKIKELLKECNEEEEPDFVDYCQMQLEECQIQQNVHLASLNYEAVYNPNTLRSTKTLAGAPYGCFTFEAVMNAVTFHFEGCDGVDLTIGLD